MVEKKVSVSSSTFPTQPWNFFMVLWFLFSGAMFRNQGHYVTDCHWGEAVAIHCQEQELGNMCRWRHIRAYVYMYMQTYIYVIPYTILCFCHYFHISYKTKVYCYCFFALLIYLLHQLRTKMITSSCISTSLPATSIVRFLFIPYK